MHHNIVLIDDNFAIRQIIKIFLGRLSRKYSFDLNIYTSDNGVEGLGYVFITNPNIVIVDTTLPKYSGKDIIEFFVQNVKFRSDEIHVIVLEENPKKKINLPKNFHRINKNKQNSFDLLTDVLIECLNISDLGRMSRLYDSLGGFVMKYSNIDDLLSKKISKRIHLVNILHRAKWAIFEILIASALAIIILIYGKPKDNNIAQSRLDRKIFRTKYYPTLALSFVSAMFILINVSLFGFTQLSVFRNNLLETKALTTFVVDTVADDADFLIGDGVCDTDDSVGDGPCTLRAAIEESNSLAGADNIHFNIPGTAPFEILTSSLLPTITSTINIDGMTQGGNCTTDAFSTPVVIVSADPLTYDTKLIFSTGAENSTLKGMKFDSAHVNIENTSDITLTCNWFDGTSTDERDNLYILNSSNIMVGGANGVNNYRNYFFNATRNGISIENSNFVSVWGNSIGLYETQTTQTAAGNENAGVWVTGTSSNVDIGYGSLPNSQCTQGCNIISSNLYGVLFQNITGTTLTVGGNIFGFGRVALADFGNGTGIEFNGDVHVTYNKIVASDTGISASGSDWSIQSNWIGDVTLGNIRGIELGSLLQNTQIDSNVIMGNSLGISLLGEYNENFGPLDITDNIIGLEADGYTPAGNNTGISFTTGNQAEGYWGNSTIEISGNTISDNQMPFNNTNLSFEGHAFEGIVFDNNRIGVGVVDDIDLGNVYGIRSEAPMTITNNNFSYTSDFDYALELFSNSTVTNNNFNYNFSAVHLDYDNTSFSGNQFNENTVSMTVSGSSNEITSNTICNTSGGEVFINNSNLNKFSLNKFGSVNDTSIEVIGTSVNNSFTHNAFAQSIEIPIDLDDNGPTANDPGDVDTGANNRQNYPDNFSLVGSDIEFDFDTNAGDYRIEFHIPDTGSCSTLSSVACSGDISHAGGNQSHSLNCPGLPIGNFDIFALSALILAPDEYGDTSELSPIVTLNNPGPTNTPTPTDTPIPTSTETPVPTATDTPVPTATDTPLPTATDTPIPTATNTPIPTPTITPLPTPTNTPVPIITSTSTPVLTNTPVVSSIPEASSTALQPTTQQSLSSPTPATVINDFTISITPTQTVRPTSQIPDEVIENLSLDLSPDDTYAIPDDSLLKSPEVKSLTLSFTKRLDEFVTDSPIIGTILKTSIDMGERIKPLSDNLSYLLSLQFIGLQTAQLGVTSLNVLALATPAIVTAFSQPKILYYALAWFWKRKSKQPWGIVYDKATGAPVAFASLVLSQEGKTVSTQATDLQGKYGFFVNKGKYQLYISHSDYLELVSDIEVSYDGEIISKDFEVIAKSRDDVNSNIRWSVYKLKRQLAKNLFILNTTIFSIGFVYTIFAITNHLTIINYVILSLYLFQFLLMIVFYFFKEKEFGQVLDVSTGLPVSGAIVRIFNEDRQIDVAITDKQGRYSFILEPGNYYLKATANGYVFPSENTPNITKNKLGNKLLKFTTQDKQRVNITVYMRKFATLNANKQVILSPFN
ncbi:carboxypeptidase regulatory-like domain-containing protein [Candidatus Dojkabacteria bacterium]|uniref:Carboxypeptidase regulatory-like domain-containing protein n=1 Tax=Candidatus Dojkabacteria bacterium TaxID=2099670 RepID=A0A955L0W7_9BACT|nr:carboxypeptidase regulatory-like domain-containing protein [Candidatus Dojkabacteria bacterium]